MKINEISVLVDNIRDKFSGEKIVTGLDGSSGIGKSTLGKKLGEYNKDFLIVERDDFILSRDEFTKLLAQAEDRTEVFEKQMANVRKLKKFIQIFRETDGPHTEKGYNRITGIIDVEKTYDFSKKIMIIEGIFLFHPEQFLDQFDLKIFVDGDREEARERRIKREKEKWGDDYFPEDHPDSAFRMTDIAFDRYLKKYKPKEAADIIFCEQRI